MYDEVSFERFCLYLRAAWSKETSADQKNWTPANPAWGQCAVSALAFQHFFGGEILRLPVPQDFNKKIAGLGSHYFNRIGNLTIDVSAEQFSKRDYEHLIAKIWLALVRTRKELLRNPDTKKRFDLLLAEMTKIACGEVVKN